MDVDDSKKSDNYYYDIIKSAVFNKTEYKQSPCFITAMTKAYFKDGNIDYALKYFEKGIENIRDVNGKRSEFLISLFDTVYKEIAET